MGDQLARLTGERLRSLRLRRGKTQAVVAGLAGISTDYLYQIEHGRKLPTLPVLLALAKSIGVSIAELLGEPAPVEPDAVPSAMESRLHRAMTMPLCQDAGRCDVAGLADRIRMAWALWQSEAGRYTAISAVLPDLILDVECVRASSGAGDGALAPVADLYGLVRTVTKRIGRMDLSIMAADRAVQAAEAAGDELRLAIARWNMAHVALAQGEHAVAEDIAISASRLLDADRSLDHAAVVGTLTLLSAIAAARRGQITTARERVGSVVPLAVRTGERNTLWTAFGPTNVGMHAFSVEAEAGDTSEVWYLADRVEPSASPSIERRVAFLLEQARALTLQQDHGGTLAMLLAAEREAPEDVAYRPAARRLVRSVMRHGGRTTAGEAARLADRLAIAVG